MRREELNLIKLKAAASSRNYGLSITHYAFATINSSLSDRRERSLLTPHSDQKPPPSYFLPPTYPRYLFTASAVISKCSGYSETERIRYWGV